MDHDQALKRAAAILGEVFEAGQIVLSWQDADGKTCMRTFGFGNYYARIGMCSEFLTLEDESTRVNIVRDNEC